MTQPMTPREKVARMVSPKCWEFYDRHAADPRMKAEINHEVAPSFQLADAILAALASGSGDHAELARLAERCTTGDPWYKEGDLRGRQTFEQFLPQDRAFIAAANPATVLALLAENAALRGDLDVARADLDHLQAHFRQRDTEATEAERNLAEARGLNERAADLMKLCTDAERFEGVSTLNVFANMKTWLADNARTFLSSTEAER